jgi:hypothetical protein
MLSEERLYHCSLTRGLIATSIIFIRASAYDLFQCSFMIIRRQGSFQVALAVRRRFRWRAVRMIFLEGRFLKVGRGLKRDMPSTLKRSWGWVATAKEGIQIYARLTANAVSEFQYY